MNIQIDKKNILLIAVIIIIVVGGSIFEFMQLSKGTKAIDQTTLRKNLLHNTSPKVNVAFTKDGFVPKEITVKVGTTVIWTNNTDNPMWVASDPHPSHTDLRGFDQLEIVYRNSIYTYTFTKIGAWKYHNHIIPSIRGTVIVNE